MGTLDGSDKTTVVLTLRRQDVRQTALFMGKRSLSVRPVGGATGLR